MEIGNRKNRYDRQKVGSQGFTIRKEEFLSRIRVLNTKKSLQILGKFLQFPIIFAQSRALTPNQV